MRTVLWAIVALLFAYAVFELYRGSRPARELPNPESAGFPAESPFPIAATRREVVEQAYAAVVEEDGGASRKDAAPPEQDPFRSQLEIQHLRREISRLETELAEQRGIASELREALRAAHEQIAAASARQEISPEYNEALVFARRGLDAQTIAERCGISLAEAELVHALAQRSTPDAGAQS